MKYRPIEIFFILLLLGTIVMLVATYIQMTKCGELLKLIDEKGGPEQVCQWACPICENLMDIGVISKTTTGTTTTSPYSD